MPVIKRTRTRAPIVVKQERKRVVPAATPALPGTKKLFPPASGEVRKDGTLKMDTCGVAFGGLDPHLNAGFRMPPNETQEYVIRVKIHGKKVSFLDISQMIDEALLRARTTINDRVKGHSYVYTMLIYAGAKDKKGN